MKLFTNEDIRAIERQTLSAEAITIHTLVQRAAAGIADEIAQRWRTSKRIVVFAGPGGNGADALAASALLIDRGYNPEFNLYTTLTPISTKSPQASIPRCYRKLTS